MTASRRAAGLPDRIDNPLIERVAAMVRSTPPTTTQEDDVPAATTQRGD